MKRQSPLSFFPSVNSYFSTIDVCTIYVLTAYEAPYTLRCTIIFYIHSRPKYYFLNQITLASHLVFID